MTNPAGFANVRAHAEAHLRAMTPAASVAPGPNSASVIKQPGAGHNSQVIAPPPPELHTTGAAVSQRPSREFSSRADERDGPGDHWVTIDGHHVLIHEPQGRQRAQTQPVDPQPFHPRIIYDKKLSEKDLALAKEKIEAALALINSKWSQLTDEEKSLFLNVEAIYADPSAKRSFVSEDTRQLTLTPDFVTTSSVPWIASSIVHDGYHVLLYKLGGARNSRGLQAEVPAMKIQLEAGKKLGLNAVEKDKLEDYIKNPSQLEKYINTPPH